MCKLNFKSVCNCDARNLHRPLVSRLLWFWWIASDFNMMLIGLHVPISLISPFGEEELCTPINGWQETSIMQFMLLPHDDTEICWIITWSNSATHFVYYWWKNQYSEFHGKSIVDGGTEIRMPTLHSRNNILFHQVKTRTSTTVCGGKEYKQELEVTENQSLEVRIIGPAARSDAAQFLLQYQGMHYFQCH